MAGMFIVPGSGPCSSDGYLQLLAAAIGVDDEDAEDTEQGVQEAEGIQVLVGSDKALPQSHREEGGAEEAFLVEADDLELEEPTAEEVEEEEPPSVTEELEPEPSPEVGGAASWEGGELETVGAALEDPEEDLAAGADSEMPTEDQELEEGAAEAPAEDFVELELDCETGELSLHEDIVGDPSQVVEELVVEPLPEAPELEEQLGEEDGPEEETDDDGSQEPPWLVTGLVEDPVTISQADAAADYLDNLDYDNEEGGLAHPLGAPKLAQYLIGHPQGLVTRSRKRPGKGGGKRYFGGQERSEDVMADKVVTGCWACGKLDHDSQDCVFKRCFVCSQQGHTVGDCESKKVSCRRCQSRGHLSEDCPDLEYSAALHADGDLEFCRCLQCGEEGHLNCGDVPASSSSAQVKGPTRSSSWGGGHFQASIPPAGPCGMWRAPLLPGAAALPVRSSFGKGPPYWVPTPPPMPPPSNIFRPPGNVYRPSGLFRPPQQQRWVEMRTETARETWDEDAGPREVRLDSDEPAEEQDLEGEDRTEDGGAHWEPEGHQGHQSYQRLQQPQSRGPYSHMEGWGGKGWTSPAWGQNWGNHWGGNGGGGWGSRPMPRQPQMAPWEASGGAWQGDMEPGRKRRRR